MSITQSHLSLIVTCLANARYVGNGMGRPAATWIAIVTQLTCHWTPRYLGNAAICQFQIFIAVVLHFGGAIPTPRCAAREAAAPVPAGGHGDRPDVPADLGIAVKPRKGCELCRCQDASDSSDRAFFSCLRALQFGA